MMNGLTNAQASWWCMVAPGSTRMPGDEQSGWRNWVFVAFACDMYGDGVAGNRERVVARITELRNDTAKLCERARAGIEVLTAHPEVDGRIAAVGYCFGGLVVLEVARSGADLAGAVSVHGSLSTPRTARAGMG